MGGSWDRELILEYDECRETEDRGENLDNQDGIFFLENGFGA